MVSFFGGILLAFLSQRARAETAICIVGSPRTYYLRRVHDSLNENFVKALDPDAKVFVRLAPSDHCDANPVNHPKCKDIAETRIDYEGLSQRLFAPESVRIEDITCQTPWLASHVCCTTQINANTGEWASFLSYERKVGCLDDVMAYEREHKMRFAMVVLVRPDLVFFEKTPPISYFESLSPRIIFSSKEQNQPLGDYIYIIHRKLLEPFRDLVHTNMDATCREHRLHWPAEYKFNPNLMNTQLAHQVFPFSFAIVRTTGDADCFRLANEVFHRNQLAMYKGQRMPLDEFCKKLVSEGYFAKEKVDEVPIKITENGFGRRLLLPSVLYFE